MGQLEDFVEEYNKLVINDEKTAYFQLVNAGTDETWHTFPNPADASRIQAAISNMGNELPTGRHSIRVQAVSEGSGAIRGQVAQAIEGRSAAAKQAGNEQVQHAKALQMNIDTADKQMASMAARLQAAQERAQEAEERAGTMVGEVYKMGDMVNGFIMERESAQLDREERESRMRSMNAIAEVMAPILGQAVTIGSMFAEIWIKDKKEEMEARAETKRKARSSNGAAHPSHDSPSVTVESETPH